MKKIVTLILFSFLFNFCDDGDLTVQNINFEDITASKCSNKDIIYKIKDSEILIVAIPASNFRDDATPTGQPITLPINTTNQVIYRQYSGDVSSSNICPNIPDASPSLVEEWNAVSGTIEITTTAIKDTDETTNATRITGYRHFIVFKNVTFDKPNGTQSYTEFVFGNYNTTVSALPFAFDEEIEKSDCDNRLFTINGSESLILNTLNYATLFENAATSSPRTAEIDSNTTLTYQLYTNVVTSNYFCTNPLPSTPVLQQEWIAVNGVLMESGWIEVSTVVVPTSQGDGYQHTIHLKKVTLKKGNSEFYLGDDYVFGSFTVIP